MISDVYLVFKAGDSTHVIESNCTHFPVHSLLVDIEALR